MKTLTRTLLLLFPTFLLALTPLSVAKDVGVRFEATSDYVWSEGDAEGNSLLPSYYADAAQSHREIDRGWSPSRAAACKQLLAISDGVHPSHLGSGARTPFGGLD